MDFHSGNVDAGGAPVYNVNHLQISENTFHSSDGIFHAVVAIWSGVDRNFALVVSRCFAQITYDASQPLEWTFTATTTLLVSIIAGVSGVVATYLVMSRKRSTRDDKTKIF